MNDTPWLGYTKKWDALKPPMRPTPAVISIMQRESTPGPVLMLGVTPEIHAAFDDIVAIDRDKSMIAAIWPGDTPTKCAIRRSWTDLDWDRGEFASIVSDCGVNMLGDLSAIAEFQASCAKWLVPGGSMVHRVMSRPDTDVTLAEIRLDLESTAEINFHAFKWKLGQHVASQNHSKVAHQQVWELFNDICSDRDRLSSITGWARADIDCIDLYRDSGVTVVFPTIAEWTNTVPSAAVDTRYLTTDDYDLSEHCPIMAWNTDING